MRVAIAAAGTAAEIREAAAQCQARGIGRLTVAETGADPFVQLAYAAPVAIKLVADGVKGVSATTMEAARSTGASRLQQIRKVQLPMARASLVLATNQGLLFVLAMAVIAGMVGAGALGYDVVLGTTRSEEWGKGAAAGITIVLLGILLDRIARRAAEPAPKETQWLSLPRGRR